MTSEADKIYYQKHREVILAKLKEKRHLNREAYNKYMRDWRHKNKESFNAYQRQRWKSGKSKAATKNWRNNNKQRNNEIKSKSEAKRRRNLGFNKLIENDWGCETDWHHVNDNDVVPIPRNLHQMCPSNNRKVHRKICNELVNILYEGELKV